MQLIRSIETHVTQQGSKPALLSAAAVLDYATLDRRANQLAHALIHLGFGTGNPRLHNIALYSPQTSGLLAGMLGILKAGACCLPVDRADLEAGLPWDAYALRLLIVPDKSVLPGPVPAQVHLLELTDPMLQDQFDYAPGGGNALPERWLQVVPGRPETAFAFSVEALDGAADLFATRYDFSARHSLSLARKLPVAIRSWSLLSMLSAGGTLLEMEASGASHEIDVYGRGNTEDAHIIELWRLQIKMQHHGRMDVWMPAVHGPFAAQMRSCLSILPELTAEIGGPAAEVGELSLSGLTAAFRVLKDANRFEGVRVPTGCFGAIKDAVYYYPSLPPQPMDAPGEPAAEVIAPTPRPRVTGLWWADTIPTPLRGPFEGSDEPVEIVEVLLGEALARFRAAAQELQLSLHTAVIAAALLLDHRWRTHAGGPVVVCHGRQHQYFTGGKAWQPEWPVPAWERWNFMDWALRVAQAVGSIPAEADPLAPGGPIDSLLRPMRGTGDRYGMQLYLVEQADRIHLVLKTHAFAERMHPGDAGRQWLESLVRLVSDQDLSLKCRQLPLIPMNAQKEILQRWQGVRMHYPGDRMLFAWVEGRAARRPDAPAISEGDQELNYGTLNARANRIAHELRKSGIRQGDIVGLASPTGLQGLVAMLGIWKSGGACLPLTGEVGAHGGAHVPVFVIGPGSAWPTVAKRLSREAVENPEMPDFDPEPINSPEDIALYLSAGTRLAKPVGLSHSNLVRLFLHDQPWHDFRDTDRWLYLYDPGGPVSHPALLGPLLTGASLRWAEAREPAAMLDEIATAQRSILATDRQTLEALCKEIARRGQVQSSIRHIVRTDSGWSLPELTLGWKHCFPRASLHTFSGSVETCFWTLLQTERFDRPVADRLGGAFSTVYAYLLDPCMVPVPDGIPGNLYIGGAAVAAECEGRIMDPFVQGWSLVWTGLRAIRLPDGTFCSLGPSTDSPH